MKYTRPYLRHAVSHLSRRDSAPSSPSFKDRKHQIRYLTVFPHFPIMYPAVLDGTTTHDLHEEVSLGEYNSENISNVLVAFAYRVERRAPNDKGAKACIIFWILVLRFTVQPKKNQPLQTITQTQKFAPFS